MLPIFKGGPESAGQNRHEIEGEVIEIRRAETIDDYFATLDFKRLEGFNANE